MAGPFKDPPLPDFVLNPLGLVPKTSDDGRNLPEVDPFNPSSYRVITDLRKSGLNATIPKDEATIQYTRFERVVDHCVVKGVGTHLAKTDISSAFRYIPMHRDDWHLLGMRLQDRYYFNKCLPFGLSTSCKIFEEFSKAIEAIAAALLRPDQDIDHYLDDFISSARSSLVADDALQFVISVCAYLGVPIAMDKTIWSTTRIKFLGLIIDTIKQMVFIPPYKIEALKGKISFIVGSKKVKVKALQSLAGSLNFYARAKPGGRTFIHRVYDAQMWVLPGYYHVSVTSELKKDLRMWQTFLAEPEKGAPFLDVVEVPAQDIGFYSDAAESVGWGVFYDSHWSQGKWEPEFLQAHKLAIAWLELYPLTVGVILWAHHFLGKRIVVNCDNTATVAIVNKQTSPCHMSMGLVRLLVHTQLRFQFTLKAQHVKGEDNNAADALSRFQESRFKDLCPWADSAPTPPPQFLWPPSSVIWTLY